ncbi:MAG TPA: hypothetical protein VGI03_08320, partial [Verrucomicrobiae bacterium]
MKNATDIVAVSITAALRFSPADLPLFTLVYQFFLTLFPPQTSECELFLVIDSGNVLREVT